MHCKIVDYGTGNVQSVCNALEHLGHRVTLDSIPNQLRDCDCLIFPGQGAFGPAMETLKNKQMVSALNNYLATNQPFIGICLGFQLLFSGSDEAEDMAGLNTYNGKCQAFDSTHMSVPHMGWNTIRAKGEYSILHEFDNALFYFVHSYFLPNTDQASYAQTNYGQDFISAIATKTHLLTQFHPEKSGDVGLDLLNQFLNQL